MNQRAEAEYQQLLYAYTSLLEALQYQQLETFCCALSLLAQTDNIYNQTESSAFTLGGTFATGKIDTGGKHTIWAVSTQDPNAGISGNTGTSMDEQHYNLRDTDIHLYQNL